MRPSALAITGAILSGLVIAASVWAAIRQSPRPPLIPPEANLSASEMARSGDPGGLYSQGEYERITEAQKALQKLLEREYR